MNMQMGGITIDCAAPQQHIDFHTDDRAGEVARLVGLGATHVADHTIPGLSWTVLQDPEGNEFCVGTTEGTPERAAGQEA